MDHHTFYTITAVAQMLDVHPETVRVWERQGLLRPARERGRRVYTEGDLQRVRFIRQLLDEWGLNMAGVRQYMGLYPCWWNDRAPSLHCRLDHAPHARPCWRRPDVCCISPHVEDEPCHSCTGLERVPVSDRFQTGRP